MSLNIPVLSLTQFMRKILIYIIAVAIFNVVCLNQAKAGIQQRTIELLEEIEDIFIRRNLCISHKDCGKKQLVFFARRKDGGTHIATYEVENSSLSDEIIEAGHIWHKRHEGKYSLSLNIYNIPHKDIEGFFKRLYKKPIRKIFLEGDK